MRTRPISVGLLSLIVVTIVGVAPARSVSSSSQGSPAFPFTLAKNYEPLAWMHGGGRFSAEAKIFLQAAGGIHPLIPGFAASADPTVSFDGKNLLFVGKKKLQDLSDHPKSGHT
ncbi:MAG: hypothetical protein ABSF15_04375 [Candidatus Sulfotelmatobacter sp.]